MAAISRPKPGGERKLWSDVVLVERLRQAVARINPDLPAMPCNVRASWR